MRSVHTNAVYNSIHSLSQITLVTLKKLGVEKKQLYLITQGVKRKTDYRAKILLEKKSLRYHHMLFIEFLRNFFGIFFGNLLTWRLLQNPTNSAKTSKIHQLIGWFHENIKNTASREFSQS